MDANKGKQYRKQGCQEVSETAKDTQQQSTSSNQIHDYLYDCILQPSFCLDESSFRWFAVRYRLLKRCPKALIDWPLQSI